MSMALSTPQQKPALCARMTFMVVLECGVTPLQGLRSLVCFVPRVAPWAIVLRPVGAWKGGCQRVGAEIVSSRFTQGLHPGLSCYAPLGLGKVVVKELGLKLLVVVLPRVAPWAVLLRPVGAWESGC